MILAQDTKVVQSFKDLSGTSASFSLPVGYYWLSFDAADPNGGTLVAVVDGASNTLVTINPDIGGNTTFGMPGIPSRGGFQITPASVAVTVQVSNGTASEVTIRG